MDDRFKKFWAPIASIIGAVLLVLQLAQAFTGNRTLVTGLLIMVSLIATGAGIWHYAFAKSVIAGIPRYSFHGLAKIALIINFGFVMLSAIYTLTILDIVSDCCGFVSTPTSTQTLTPDATQILQDMFNQIDSQFRGLPKVNIAFNKPEQMEIDKTAIVELILNPSLSESALATEVVERGNFVTSTAEPYMLIAPSGETVTVETSQIEITPRMKAVLLPRNSEAFTIQEMHDSAEQVVSSERTTSWRWSITAKKEGLQTLELVIFQLVKYDGKEFWSEVETYKASILVKVTVTQHIKSLDWQWIAGIVITLIGIPALWRFIDNRKKKKKSSK